MAERGHIRCICLIQLCGGLPLFVPEIQSEESSEGTHQKDHGEEEIKVIG